MNIEKTKKNGSIGLKIILGMTITTVVILIALGSAIFFKVSELAKNQYKSRIASTLNATDAAFDIYFENLESFITAYAANETLQEDDDSITSYVELSSPSGKIPMDPANFSPYELEVFTLAKSFVDEKVEFQNKINGVDYVIKSAMDEQTAGSQQVLNAMHEINNITSEVKNGAAEMERGGRQISSEMDNLAMVTSEISGSMNEMSTGVSDINNAMQRINEKTTENGDSISRVTKEIKKFKV